MADDVTPEERADLRKNMGERMKQIGIARQAILDTKQPGGVMRCPICETGRLTFTVARNGHVHAHCSTRLCMSWME